MKTATFSKKLVRKKVLVPTILGVGILLSAALITASPLENSWAQESGMNKTTNTDTSQYTDIPRINGSVNVRDGIKNFFTESTNTPFTTGAQTAQDQIANGTVVGGHIGVTQGYLTYTYLVVDPTNDIARKVVIDAGNGQVLYTSEGKQVGSWGQSMFESFGQGRGHGGGGGFGPFSHGFGPFGGGGGIGPFGGFWHNK